MFLPPKFTSKSDYLNHSMAYGSWVSKRHKAYPLGERCTLSPQAVKVLQAQLTIVHICWTRECFLSRTPILITWNLTRKKFEERQ